MRSTEHSLRRLPIALQRGLTLDLEAVEQEIDRQVTLSGGSSQDVALARLAIARTKDPEAAAAYIQRYRNQMVTHLNPSFLAGVEIDSLVTAGKLRLAETRLDELLAHGVPAEERERLSQILADARDSDPTASREKPFAATDALSDLHLLVEALEHDKDWARLAQYADILFRRTGDIPSCRLYVQSLFQIADFPGVITFLRTHQDLLSSSAPLESYLAWSLYNVGDVNGCSETLTPLRHQRDAEEDRHLAVNLAITSGDWSSLARFVEQEWAHRDRRSAEALLRAGQLAHHLSLARSKALITEAARTAGDDPHVLLGCYTSAMAAGWEDEATFGWLEQAAALSSADGPVQRMSLKEMLDRQPEWQQRVTQSWEQLNAGLIPVAAYVRTLNRSLAEHSLLPALANFDTIDPRRRTLLYNYSGARRALSGTPQSLALDPTALLTLGMLGLLERVVDTSTRVVLPHTTLSWLFEERQRLRSHQPSRVADARNIRRLLDSGVLQRLEPTTPTDETLAREVGHELASLFADAEADWGEDHRPRRVVRSRPIHRVDSLMQEEADLGSHIAHVCGCLDVIDALVRQGRLTQAEEQRARSFLTLHETQWAGISSIAPRSVLYMDGVSLAHFQHLRLLPKFEASGFTVMISPSEIVECDRRIRHDALTERASAVIENIRSVLSDRIAGGTTTLAPRLPSADTDDRDLDHPAIDIVRIAGLADVAVIDDRYFNQHAQITHDHAATPVWTTLDLLGALALNSEQHVDYLSRMRSAGLAFVPVTSEELTLLLSRSPIAHEHVVESAELKAFRENLQLCRMTNGLQLPKESHWQDTLVRVLIDAIKAQWLDDTDLVASAARSTWLLQLLELRGWSQGPLSEPIRPVAESHFRARLVGLMILATEAPTTARDAYWNWLDQVLLNGIREQQSDLYSAVIKDIAHLITRTVTLQHTEGGNGK